MLPKISGEQVCNKIRATSSVPIIMLTAKAEEDNKIDGLAIGADDYITKPFSNRELVGRVKAIIRRTYRDTNPLAQLLIINNGDLEIDIEKMIIKRFESKFIPLSNLKDFNLDYIRLARDYTNDVYKDYSKQSFIQSISELATLLNIKVLAENVKNDEDMKFLRKYNLYAVSR